MSVVEDLRSDLQHGNVVLVVGTGVSMAATNDGRANWPGFLRTGVEYGVEHGFLDAESETLCYELLEQGAAADLLSVADEIVCRIGGQSGHAFEDWLRRTIGGLTVSNSDLPKAIVDLGYPILTTNYDSVLESVSGLEHVSWRSRGNLQQVVSGSLRLE